MKILSIMTKKQFFKKMSVTARRFLRICFSALPKFLKHPLMRSMIHIEYNLSSDYTFKIAETKEELEQAFRILHDAYVEMKFMNPDPSGLRVTLYHAIPHT
ncbi:MAG: hypothetical protein KDD38_06765, partial [Bdellovibrionales bacterium]|nr:hypothetical protein [Bdellovibrionales bacterium]